MQGVLLCDVKEKEGKELVSQIKDCFGKDKASFMKVDVQKDKQFEGTIIDILLNIQLKNSYCRSIQKSEKEMEKVRHSSKQCRSTE